MEDLNTTEDRMYQKRTINSGLIIIGFALLVALLGIIGAMLYN